MQAWKSHCVRLFQDCIEDSLKQRDLWVSDGCGLGLPGSIAAEMFHHVTWAAKKLSDFVGREELVHESLQTIARENRPAGASRFTGISLLLVGASGTGKTALMAKLAQLLYDREQASRTASFKRPVIFRFCGTSSASTTGLSLVRSICAQIHFTLGLSKNSKAKTTSLTSDASAAITDVQRMDYDNAVAHLHKLLRNNPIILFIDGIDQLSDENLARSSISFLRDVKPHRSTRIIVSTVPDSHEQHYGKPQLF
jgi:Cdc6-like AAA superfamily ATPase